MTKRAEKPRGQGQRGEKNYNAIYYVTLRDAERSMLLDALLAFDGDMSAAAEFLGVSVSQVSKRIHVLGGILPNEPRLEPFDETPYVKALRAKRDNSDSSDDDEDDDQGEPSDQSARTPDGDDAEQERHQDAPSQ